jgi:hypothetical protein
MRRVVVSVLAAALLGMTMPAGVAASTSICPDGMFIFPTFAVQSGQAKDKNNNGLVCAKYLNGDTKGGPDDRTTIDDIVI